MKYFLVFGAMYNKIVMANSKDEIDGKVLAELTPEEAKEYAESFERPSNID